MEVSSLTTHQKKELKKTFDGQLEPGTPGLTQQQAREALCLLGLNPTGLDITKFWNDLEKSESESINLEEFMKLRCFVDEDPETVLRWAFNKFDSNNDGTIDRSELRKILLTVYNDAEGEFVDDEFVEHVLKLADENGDGVLQIEDREFVEHVLKLVDENGDSVLQTEEFVDMLTARTGSPQTRTSS